MTRQKFEPRPYTGLALDFLAQHPRNMLLARMGMGKTVICATMLDILYNVDGQTEPTLVIAPKRVAQTTWPDELAKWDHLRDLEIASAVGSAAERAAALRRDVPIHAINYDNLPWLKDHLGDRWPYRRVIADESTRIKSFRVKQGGAQAGALRAVAHTKVREWWNLSGAPTPNGLKDLWGQMWFVDQGKRLGYSYAAFEERYFAYKRIKDAVTHRVEIKPIILPYADQHIHEAVADVCLTLDPKDWFDLKDPIITRITVDLPPKARRHYDDMERDMFTRLEGFDIEAFGQAGKTMKCLQCANGAMYTNAEKEEWAEVHDEKLQALGSIIEEAAGAPVLVAYHFKSDLARLRKAFPKGQVLDKGTRVQAEWNKGNVPLLFVHPASMGHGLNFQQGGNILVFFGHWWDLDKHDQVVERIGPMRQFQAGLDRAVFLYYIVARDTVDEVVIDRHTTKRGVQELFLNYMNRRRKK